jgi:RHS repeat-associated protein
MSRAACWSPNRHESSDKYRFGFQGQEKDDEIKGEGNSINYKYRMHDPRVGRFFAVDPMYRQYSWNSPYAFSENIVIHGVEIEGLEVGWSGWAKDLPPEVANEAALAMQVDMETFHMLLDGYGFVPVVGEVLDGINAVIYAYEGDYLNAAFSTISIAPIAGDIGAKGMKYSMKAAGISKKFKSAKTAKKWISTALEYNSVKIANALEAPRRHLKKALNSAGTGKAAHHLIPVNMLKNNKFVQQAVEEGFDFNGIVNGLALDATQHSGKHPNIYIQGIEKMIEATKSALPDASAKEVLESVADKLKTKLEGTGVKVNDLFKE